MGFGSSPGLVVITGSSGIAGSGKDPYLGVGDLEFSVDSAMGPSPRSGPMLGPVNKGLLRVSRQHLDFLDLGGASRPTLAPKPGRL